MSAKTSTADASSGSSTREWARRPAARLRLRNRSAVFSLACEFQGCGVAMHLAMLMLCALLVVLVVPPAIDVLEKVAQIVQTAGYGHPTESVKPAGELCSGVEPMS